MELNLLARIRKLENELGQGVNEDILTDLIRAEGALSEYGFGFLRVSNGFAVFEVPKQNKKNWYRKRGWPATAKEQLVEKIAKKYDLEIYEPPDAETTTGESHHHFELGHTGIILLVAHPRYLMIRISNRPLIPEKTLLEDLSALYECDFTAADLEELSLEGSQQ